MPDQAIIEAERFAQILNHVREDQNVSTTPQAALEDVAPVDVQQGARRGQVNAGGGSAGSEGDLMIGSGDCWGKARSRGVTHGAGTGLGTGTGVGNGEGAGIGAVGHAPGVAMGVPGGTGNGGGGISRAPVPESVSGGDYPARARRELREGVVLVRVNVLESGKVGEVELARSSGHSDLDTAALKAAAKWRFNPAQRDGNPIATWLKVPVRYILKDVDRQ